MKPLTAEEIAELRRLFPPVARGNMVTLHREDYEHARNALPRLLDEVERSRALLKRIEWMGSAYPDASDMPCCPACDSQHKHEPDCELAALIGP